MAKRFSETEIWNEDWFLEMPNEYKLFWFYVLSKCDHAGIFRVNLKSFRGLLEVNLTTDKALVYINHDKQRIRVISESIWYIEDFYVFQYGTTLNLNNRMHYSISEILKKHGIDLTSIRGLKDLKDRVKDKDKDKDIIQNNNTVENNKDSVGQTKTDSVPPVVVGTDLAIDTARLVWNDQRWREQVCMGNSISEDDLKKWMAQFNASIANDSMPDFNAGKYKKLFGGWLNTQKGKGYKLSDTNTAKASPTLKIPEFK